VKFTESEVEEAALEIAQELTDSVRKSATIDWNVRESVWAAMKIMCRRLLR
jgi:type I restriction enzyme R subunit